MEKETGDLLEKNKLLEDVIQKYEGVIEENELRITDLEDLERSNLEEKNNFIEEISNLKIKLNICETQMKEFVVLNNSLESQVSFLAFLIFLSFLSFLSFSFSFSHSTLLIFFFFFYPRSIF